MWKKRLLISAFFALFVASVLAAQTPQPTPKPTEAPAQSVYQLPALPESFDLRDVGAITPIKNQSGGTCWTHGTMAAIESNLIVSGVWKGMGMPSYPDCSEYHLDWWNGFNKHVNSDLGDKAAKDSTGMTVHQGGDYRVAAAYISRGDGVVPAPCKTDFSRDITWYKETPKKADPNYKKLYVRDIEWFTMGDNLERIDVIKRRFMTEGAMGTCYCSNNKMLTKDFIHYQPKESAAKPNHAVAIVGWDDKKVTKDAPNANKAAPPKPGAWLIKNSWGTKSGDKGFYWISYYDKNCARDPEIGAVSFRNIEPLTYTDIYYHDYHGWRDTLPEISRAFNAFTATGTQQLRAISFFTAKDGVNYTAKIYSRFENGQLTGEVASQSGSVRFTGFHTINLDTPLWLKEKEKFYVYVELSDGGHAIDRTSIIPVLLEEGQRGGGALPTVLSTANPGESFYFDGKGWKDLYTYEFKDPKHNKTANFCIKALAVSLTTPKVVTTSVEKAVEKKD